jgi:hypothetical protein
MIENLADNFKLQPKMAYILKHGMAKDTHSED